MESKIQSLNAALDREFAGKSSIYWKRAEEYAAQLAAMLEDIEPERLAEIIVIYERCKA